MHDVGRLCRNGVQRIGVEHQADLRTHCGARRANRLDIGLIDQPLAGCMLRTGIASGMAWTSVIRMRSSPEDVASGVYCRPWLLLRPGERSPSARHLT